MSAAHTRACGSIRLLSLISVMAPLPSYSMSVREGWRCECPPRDRNTRTPVIHFRLLISQSSVEINGQIAWVSKSRTKVGIKFIDLQDEARSKIRSWIYQQSSQQRFEKQIDTHGRVDELLIPASTCHISEVRLDQDWQPFSKGWRECNSRFNDHTIYCDPDWIARTFQAAKRKRTHIFLRARKPNRWRCPLCALQRSAPLQAGRVDCGEVSHAYPAFAGLHTQHARGIFLV